MTNSLEKQEKSQNSFGTKRNEELVVDNSNTLIINIIIITNRGKLLYLNIVKCN